VADLLDGVARHLMSRGLLTYDPTGRSGDTFIESLPSTPDVCVVLTIYDDGTETDSQIGHDDVPVQVRVRGTTDPRPSRQLAQSIRDELLGLSETLLPDGTYLLLGLGNAAVASMGTDENRRHEHVANLVLRVRSATPHRV
jgi:hypothetical protein